MEEEFDLAVQQLEELYSGFVNNEVVVVECDDVLTHERVRVLARALPSNARDGVVMVPLARLLGRNEEARLALPKAVGRTSDVKLAALGISLTNEIPGRNN